ncbi:hypothetical protein [Bacillus atrophaeus]|uniref:hypothetical protein n=1 Tax=Bacillus atrophaeus TaxID=1452 RepID=UPI001C122EAB|nr:hypothetical protein [Bacillus atrophaeus]MBU5262190.1 hypothetical protein [Bacillus atrophaeus]
MNYEQRYLETLDELYGIGKYEFEKIAQGKDACLCLVSARGRFELVRMHIQKDEIQVSIDAKFNPEKIGSELLRMSFLAKNLYATDYKRLIEGNYI